FQFDVKLPRLEAILTDNRLTSQASGTLDPLVSGANGFIALCELTQILGNLLPLIYEIEPRDAGESMRNLITSEQSLKAWEAALPSFKKTSKWNDAESDRIHRLYRSRSRDTAKEISEFLVQLERKDLNAFWLPYATYHFTSAVTMLLRCALEAETRLISRECMISAKRMVRHLRRLKDESSWDLADNCLEQCESLVGRMSEDVYLEGQEHQEHPSYPSQHPPNPMIEDPSYASEREVSQDGSAATAGFRTDMETLVSGIPFTGLDYGILENVQGGFWNGNWHMAVPDPWLAPGIDESGNFGL
ncbi:hypothetical protein S7711_11619, partial [Stachybotrys chartarum IBT 7711]